MYLACSLFVGFVGHSICRICSPKNWTKKITNIPVFHQWLRTKHTFFCQYKHNQGRRQIFSKRGGQGKHAIFNGNPCIFLKFLRPGGGKFCSHLAFRFPRGGLYTILGCWGYSDPLASPHAEVTEYKKIFTFYEKIYDILFQITDDIPNKKVSVYNISTPNNVISLKCK